MIRNRELWEQCADWLVEARIELPNVPKLQLRDLAASLKDGVRLCKLANTLKSGCVEYRHIYNIQGSEFTQEKNVLLFINALRDSFGFKEQDLFDPQDLTQFEGFKKVINTLSRLSHTNEAVNRGLKPFPEATSPSSFSSISSGDDIYCNLHNQIDPDDEAIYGLCHYKNENDNDDIYDRIVAHRPGKSEFEKFVPTSKRQFQIKELLETETNYLKNCLEMLINDFYRPLKNCLSTADYQKIFRNIHDIYLLHSSFHQNLQTAVHKALGITKNGNSMIEESGIEVIGIGDVFTKHKSQFLKYAEYCANMDEARETLDFVEKTDPPVRRKIQDLLKESKTDFRLQDLLSVPFQRICKYHLLLQNIVDSTTDQSMERERLVAGLMACKDVVDFVNEAKRDDDNQKVIAHIERSIINMEATCNFYLYGRLKQDGVAKITDFSDSQPKAKQRYVFIFERIILICKKLKNEIFEYKASYELKHYSIQDTQTESPTSTTKSTSTLTRLKTATRFDYNTFTLLNAVNSHKIQIDLKSPAQKKIWKEAIEYSINKCTPAEGIARMHQLTYKTYDTPTDCDNCHKLLKGLFYQGYHCSRCKRDLHYGCINQAFCGTRHRSSESNSISAPKPERFIAIQTIKSQDPEVLNFDLNEEVIITGIADNGMFIGRRTLFPGRSGYVSQHTVRPLSHHLMIHRGSLASIGTLSGNSNLNDSNTGSCLLESHSAGNLMNETNFNFHDFTPQPSSTSTVTTPTAAAAGTTMPTTPNGLQQNKILASKKITNFNSQIWDIKSYPWYFGVKERIQANEILMGSPDGTFIVRLSERENKYVISISFKGGCKHMKIEQGEEPVLGKIYWLHDAKHFTSIPELIKYYHENCLSECFENIDTKLSKTLLKTRLYKVTYGYSRNSETNRYLTLKKEDVVELTDTAGEETGWWKFQAGDQIGFYPMDYVEPIEDGEIGEHNEERDVCNAENNGLENGITAC